MPANKKRISNIEYRKGGYDLRYPISAIRNQRGQFIPISAMVMFTSVVFMMAVVNVYTVSKAKLQVQNLADAAALNVASQVASSMNKVPDLNEWMNNMVAGQSSKPGEIPNCANVSQDLPPIACAENETKSSNLNVFSAKGTAAQYAGLIQKINQTQQLFVDTYNNFIGAGSRTMSASTAHGSLASILAADIPDLDPALHPDTQVFIWNTDSGDPALQSGASPVTPAAGRSTAGAINSNGMQPLKFKIHEITVTYKSTTPLIATGTLLVKKTLGQLLVAGSNQSAPLVGWMVPDTQPTINVNVKGSKKPRIGVGALVIRHMKVPVLGTIEVKSEAMAYVVEGSGMTGSDTEMQPDPTTGVSRPVFKPTYWVKLAGVQ